MMRHFIVLFKSLALALFLSLINTLCYAQTGEKALLVLDVQENFINPESKLHIDTTGLDVFLGNINTTVTHFNQQNDHVIYVVNEWTSPIKNWFTGNVCKKGAPGTEIAQSINVINANVFSKSKGNALTNDELLSFLKTNNVSELIVVGLFAEGCVKATVGGGVKEGFSVVVIEDALGSKNAQKKAQILQQFEEKGITTMLTKDL